MFLFAFLLAMFSFSAMAFDQPLPVKKVAKQVADVIAKEEAVQSLQELNESPKADEQKAIEFCIYEVEYSYVIGDDLYVGGGTYLAPCPGQGWIICLPAGYFTVCL